ncbi:exodeoxyribonuclease VII large subunit [Frigidibacter sp. ROC022]|uniref:exodeoxyribonuclease VII large subunit n=1 Tax=Frigidibacter sp. ROC022 TaxID=2971796 RepID=UPI00215B40D7|nr:exodeoxyribonuclease VII large subunit [Frigidibacter sp. ROC022]MCR8725353.1 exodeoxyribonuclease VII large subunit [Frigidibacter sp. ROC022]
MSDLFEDDASPDAGPGGNAHEFSVGEISGAVKRLIEGEFGQVRVRGEVGRCVLARTGHLYFDLKDDRAVLAAVSWKGQVARMSVRPEEGMEVVATGRLTTYAGQSKYQLIVDDIRPAGAGALMAMLEKRRAALQAEGLFDPARKKKLPYLPEVIGVVTSPSGAVIRDILHRLRDRFPRKVLIWPVAVQGEKCAPEVARAIAGFNALSPGGAIPRPDLIIVARGGGSIEDLWGFNEEAVVRAAAASEIPLISAVGHETDTTLIDHAADVRAPTPTAAAELAVPVRLELMAWTAEQGGRLRRALTRGLAQRGQRLRDLSRALPRPDSLTENARQRLDRADAGLEAALTQMVAMRRLQLSRTAGKLHPALLTQRVDAARSRLAEKAGLLPRALTTLTERRGARLDRAAARLRPAGLERDLAQARRNLTGLMQRLRSAARNAEDRRARKLEALERLRLSVGYTETLKRGYAVVRGDGHVVTTAEAAGAATALEIEFRDGRLPVAGRGATPPAAPKKRGRGTPDDQGSLF